MIKRVRRIFKPETIYFNYSLPFNSVRNELEKNLEQKETLMNEIDFKGNFINESEFQYDLISHVMSYGAKYSATMQCEIKSLEENLTRVELTPRNSWTIYALLIISYLCSLISLINFMKNWEIKTLIFFFAFLLLGPLIIAVISEASISALHLRYNKYLENNINSYKISN